MDTVFNLAQINPFQEEGSVETVHRSLRSTQNAAMQREDCTTNILAGT